jgi:hypothetical protein
MFFCLRARVHAEFNSTNALVVPEYLGPGSDCLVVKTRYQSQGSRSDQGNTVLKKSHLQFG